MIQSLNVLFHFNNLIKIDDQESKTKNKELNFVFEIHNEIVSVRKTREMFENRAQLDEIVKSKIGFHEIDYLEIFFWKKKSYLDSSGLPYKTYLVKLRNVYFDGFSRNFTTISMKFFQDRLDLPIDVLARNLIKSYKVLSLTKEKNILKFQKKEQICQKSIDILHYLS
jgi:hypothetical protein